MGLQVTNVRAAYRVYSELGKWGNRWVVIRKRDGKVMTENAGIYVCLRWIRSWGEDRL